MSSLYGRKALPRRADREMKTDAAGWRSVAGSSRVLEKECRQLRSIPQARLPVDRKRLLSDGRFRGGTRGGDLFMAESFQHEEAHLAFGRTESPPLELAVDRFS